MQVEVQYALVACSVFCLRPFMAAVSTNYGTAGDSTLEDSASRSNGTKEGSKTGGSGSNSRTQRKRAGTGPRLPPVPPAVSGSGSGSRSRQSDNHGPDLGAPLHLDTSTHAHGTLGNNTKDGHSARSDTVCPPVRRSMFPLSAPRKKLSFQMLDKGKNGMRAGSGGLFTDESDLIELMPRPHTRHASDATELEDEEGPDRMVIHKEIRYSIQYEDDAEAELRGREDSKINSVDVTVYV